MHQVHGGCGDLIDVRLSREHEYYAKEVEDQEAKVERMKIETPEAYEIKKQEELLTESRSMLPDTKARLDTAIADLKDHMVRVELDHTLTRIDRCIRQSSWHRGVEGRRILHPIVHSRRSMTNEPDHTDAISSSLHFHKTKHLTSSEPKFQFSSRKRQDLLKRMRGHFWREMRDCIPGA